MALKDDIKLLKIKREIERDFKDLNFWKNKVQKFPQVILMLILSIRMLMKSKRLVRKCITMVE